MRQREVKNIYIGGIYTYSYDFRGKNSATLTNDGWTIVIGTPSFGNYGMYGNTIRLKRDISQYMPTANKITLEEYGTISGSALGWRIGKTVTTSVREGLSGVYFSYTNGEWSMTIYDGESTKGTGITNGTYLLRGIIDLKNGVWSLECTGKTTMVGTISDTDVNNIRNNTNVLFAYVDGGSSSSGLATGSLIIE